MSIVQVMGRHKSRLDAIAEIRAHAHPEWRVESWDVEIRDRAGRAMVELTLRDSGGRKIRKFSLETPYEGALESAVDRIVNAMMLEALIDAAAHVRYVDHET